MKKQLILVFLICFSFSFYLQSFAQEVPSFCSLDNFMAHEVSFDNPVELIGSNSTGDVTTAYPVFHRKRAFRFGDLYFVGLGLKYSKTHLVIQMALDNGINEDDKYCTWYLARTNKLAYRKFNKAYVPNFSQMNKEESINVFMRALKKYFVHDGNSSIVKCAKKGHLVLGCNSQKHRGPTGIGMILAFAGCPASNATKIVNHIWGLNGVRPHIREAVIHAAYQLGSQYPELRERLADSFGDD